MTTKDLDPQREPVIELSSDAGEPLFPNSVECMRLMRAYMRAFGLTAKKVCS